MRLFLAFCLLFGSSASSAQRPFAPVEYRANPTEAVFPPAPLRVDLLYHQSEQVQMPNGTTAPARRNFDFIGFLPAPNSFMMGTLWVNHECRDTNAAWGDGGGGSWLDIVCSAGGWKRIGPPRAADFSPVAGTRDNCLGCVTPWGSILTSEEYEPTSNAELFDKGKGIRDTSDYKGSPRYLNYGWMVEMNPQTGKAVAKRKGLGRFSHESCLFAKDNKTVYMTDDLAPGVWFKYVSPAYGDLQQGQLFAFRENGPGQAGIWIPIPKDSVEKARAAALRRGATVYIRLEDVVELPDGRLLITETGHDSTDLRPAERLGGHVSAHLERFRKPAGHFSDYYGRILVFDPQTNQMDVWLEGGASSKGQAHLANPDNLALHPSGKWLVIHEDINNVTQGRVPAEAAAAKRLVNELFCLPVPASGNPKLDDLLRLAMVPAGAESTGGCWSPDGETLFVNFQHPLPTNIAPWNKDCTLAFTGFRFE